ncbi:AlpA family transcriptional regulator [Bradyrhizobium sp. Bra64]|uniref:helix-turn-helix transcriptional regulator n=1 Tax=Bradyrhizobium sp. Bra64 TaxID=2926009 RepID=UPI00211983D8|nr:AlpA family phage regulatory protein [Bradyrhizobium sp. Bra64]
MLPTTSGPRRMMSEAEVRAVVPVSRSTLWRMEREGKFPPATYISANRRVWFEDQIIAWQNQIDGFSPYRRRGNRRRAQPDQPVAPS